MSQSLSLNLSPYGIAPLSTPTEATARSPEPRCLRSEDLFAEHETLVLIKHRGATYRLHKTRLGKLILNK